MIKKVADRFQEIKGELLKQFSAKQPSDYEDILRKTLILMYPEPTYGDPDTSKIRLTDDGDYQGTLLFVIPQKCYQPDTYFVTKVYYGSCSGCDTYQAYENYSNPSESAPEMVTLAMHMIQQMKEV